MAEVRATNGAALIHVIKIPILIGIFLLYLVSPIDIIPEFIFGIFGYIDDVLAFGYILMSIAGVIYKAMVDINRRNVRAR